jgi:hypothetical protein
MGKDNNKIILPHNKRYDFKIDFIKGIFEDIHIEWTDKEIEMIGKIKKEKKIHEDI